MPGTLVIPVELDDGDTILVAVEEYGSTPVGLGSIVGHLGAVTSSIEVVSRRFLDMLKRVGPEKATVEIGIGLAVQEGELVALFGKAHADASIKVTFEWSRGSQGGPTTSPAQPGAEGAA